MNEELSQEKYLDLQDRTLANNLAWLKSFGCEVRRASQSIQVTHSELPEYNALIILGAGLSSNLLHKSNFGAVYVDELIADSVEMDLYRSDYRLAFFSQVKIARRTSEKSIGQIKLREALHRDMIRWSELYAEGFNQPVEQARANLARWETSFHDPSSQFWFFIDEGREVGVFQTYCRNDVIGLYSVTLQRGYRTLRKIISAGRALRSTLPLNYSNYVYFERITGRIPATKRRTPVFRKFMTLRRFLIFKKASPL